jgi:hypothetical protein
MRAFFLTASHEFVPSHTQPAHFFSAVEIYDVPSSFGEQLSHCGGAHLFA